MKILEGEGITKNFGGVIANRDISFFLEEREILGLIGPNGSGKTTLINIVGGNIKPDRGEIRFEGKNIIGLKPYRICRLGICRTYQVVQPFSGMTVRETVVAGTLFGRTPPDNMPMAHRKAAEVLESVNLLEKSDEPVEELTVADLKKLELAKALSGDPKVLLLDEVMAGLTPREIDEAMELILGIRERGVTIFIVEHVMKAVMGISDRVMVLHQGMRMATGVPQEIIRNEGVIKAYLGEKYVGKRDGKGAGRNASFCP
jgi:branched-chain amino acid transport system ATP-binding protein